VRCNHFIIMRQVRGTTPQRKRVRAQRKGPEPQTFFFFFFFFLFRDATPEVFARALWATRRRRPFATRPEARLRKPFVIL
jgi:hypothetical protein